MSRLSRLLVLLALIGAFAWTFIPPSLYANDYLLFATAMGGTKAQIYQMDGGGTLGLREERTTGVDVYDIAVSPDGKTVVAGGATTPTLSVFFIKDDGSLSDPQYMTPPDVGVWDCLPIAFHNQLPVFFAGNYSKIASIKYNSNASQAESTGQCITPADFFSIRLYYSPWAKSLIFQAEIGTGQPLNAIQSLQINDDGGFSKITPKFQLPGQMNPEGLTVSPDGRWLAVILLGVPMRNTKPTLLLFSIGQDGTLSLADQIVNESSGWWLQDPVLFTPDSRRLLMFAPGDAFVQQYDVDQQTGKLSQCKTNQWNWDDMGGEMNLPMCLTVTPDGRYAAFRSAKDYPPDAQHNWIHVVRLNEDGTTTYLPEKRIEVDHYVGAMAFTYLPHNAVVPQWALYE